MTRKKILVAMDFSEGSDEALEQAIDLARQTGGQLEILHVLELGADQFPFGLSYYDDNRGGLIALVDRELTARTERAIKAGLIAESRIVEGSAATEIVRRAREGGAALIVIGTHGRRGLAHAVLGSVAERVVQYAACPVLTVPFSRRAA